MLTFVPLWWLIEEKHYIFSIIHLELLLDRISFLQHLLENLNLHQPDAINANDPTDQH